MTGLRQKEPALNVGNYKSVESGADDVMAYLRTADNADKFLVVLNFAEDSHILNLRQVGQQATIAVATDRVRSGPVDLSNLLLGPNEGLVLRVS